MIILIHLFYDRKVAKKWRIVKSELISWWKVVKLTNDIKFKRRFDDKGKRWVDNSSSNSRKNQAGDETWKIVILILWSEIWQVKHLGELISTDK